MVESVGDKKIAAGLNEKLDVAGKVNQTTIIL